MNSRSLFAGQRITEAKIRPARVNQLAANITLDAFEELRGSFAFAFLTQDKETHKKKIRLEMKTSVLIFLPFTSEMDRFLRKLKVGDQISVLGTGNEKFPILIRRS